MRTRWAGCAALLVLGALFLHHEVLWGGMVYHMDDAADGYYPSHVAAARAIAGRELPTWERGSWCGWPQLADPYYGFYYPLTALFYLLGAVRGLGFAIVVHVVLAALGMLWLCRQRGLGPGPALLAASSLAFSSFMVVRIRHIIFPELVAWLPVLLAAAEGWWTTGRRACLVLASFATAAALLCGALPLLPYVFLLVGAYVLPQALRRADAPWTRWAALAAAAAVGALIAMAQIVPTLAHLPLSPRSRGVDYWFASTYAWPELRYLATLVAPDILGTEERSRWYGAYNHWEMAGYYAGALPVFLSPLGLLRRGRPERWALFAVALLGIGLAFGDEGPFHAWFFHHVPLYAGLRCPARSLVMTMVAVAILGADGLASLSDRVSSAGRSALGVLVALALMGMVAVVWWALAPLAAGLGPQAQTARALRQFAGVVGGGGVVIALAAGSWISWRVAEVAVAVLTLAELLAVGRGYVQPRPADWAAGTERFTAVDWLLEQHPTDRFVPGARGPFRLHNLGMTYGPPLEGASGYESFGVWRYVNFLWTVNHGAPYRGALHDDLAAGDVKRFDTPWVDFLNVRWAIAPAPPAPHWIERFRPAPGAPPHARHEPGWDPLLNVYENPRVLPRAFVVYRAVVLADDEAQARALLRTDPRSVAVLDRQPAIALLGPERSLTRSTIVERGRHRLVIDAEPEAPGILVTSETAYPGWTATVDGREAPLLRANYAFRAVALGPGRHRVEMRFRSRPAEVGLWLSALGCLGLVGLGAVRWRGLSRSDRGG